MGIIPGSSRKRKGYRTFWWRINADWKILFRYFGRQKILKPVPIIIKWDKKKIKRIPVYVCSPYVFQAIRNACIQKGW